MRKIIIGIALLSFFRANAQFDFSTGKDVYLEITEAYQTAEIHCVPNPVGAMSINWDLIESDPNLPSGWTYTICDQICYPFFSDHGSPVDFTASQFNSGQSYKLKLGVTTNEIEGSGFFKYFIYDINNPSYGDTVTFNLNYQSNGLNENTFSENDVQYSVSNNVLTLSSNNSKEHEIELISTNGIRILNTHFESNTIIDQPFPAGVYYLIIDREITHKIVFFN